MASINKAILIGNLGADPEIRTLPSGTQVANMRLATSTSWKDDAGVKQERTEWHDVVAFDRLAEIAAEFLKKGKSVYVEGSLQTRTWEDAGGVKHYRTEIKANTILMLGAKVE